MLNEARELLPAVLPSAGVRLSPLSPSEGLSDESAAPPAAVTLKSVAFTLVPSAFCIAVWMRLVRVELAGDRFAPVRLYAACSGKQSQDLSTAEIADDYKCVKFTAFDWRKPGYAL